MRFKFLYMEQVPIVIPPPNIQAELTKIVRHFAEICDDPVSVAEGEQAVNEIVYHLYGLTDDEIAIAEGKL